LGKSEKRDQHPSPTTRQQKLKDMLRQVTPTVADIREEFKKHHREERPSVLDKTKMRAGD